MNKQEILKQFSKEEDKLLAAKLLDKIQFTNTKNKIENTDFLDGYEQKIAQKILINTSFSLSILFGGYEEAERKMLFLFPEKLESLMQDPLEENKAILEKIKVISIKLPNELQGQYHHRDYLSALMKLGLKREKIGDILVNEKGADILVQTEIVPYLLTNLQQLTRFQKSDILQKTIKELDKIPVLKETMTILVSGLRLDAVVSELAHISRTKANEIIEKEKVLVNYETKIKNATSLKEGDLLTIRGKGKFQIGEVVYKTSKGNLKVMVEKFVS